MSSSGGVEGEDDDVGANIAKFSRKKLRKKQVNVSSLLGVTLPTKERVVRCYVQEILKTAQACDDRGELHQADKLYSRAIECLTLCLRRTYPRSFDVTDLDLSNLYVHRCYQVGQIKPDSPEIRRLAKEAIRFGYDSDDAHRCLGFAYSVGD